MKEYFSLQFRLINRKVADYGLNPLIGYMLFVALFMAGSFLLFSKTKYALYVYPLIATGIIYQLSEFRRNDFLKICFRDSSYKKIRIMENLIVAVPFILFLAFKLYIIQAIIIVLIAVLFSFFRERISYTFILPTPFSKQPYEFIVGFRKTWFLFVISYLLAIAAVIVQNFNLGAFALVFVFLIACTFYTAPENEYIVWSFNVSAVKFLLQKTSICFMQASVLAFPLLLVLLIFFPPFWLPLFIIQGVGYLALTTILLTKYAAYPDPISIPQGVMLALCVQLPVLLFAVIPFFYYQSTKNLKRILG